MFFMFLKFTQFVLMLSMRRNYEFFCGNRPRLGGPV